MRYQDEVGFFGVESYERQFRYMMTKTFPTKNFELCVDLFGFFRLVVINALGELVWTLVCELLVCLGEGRMWVSQNVLYEIYTLLMFMRFGCLEVMHVICIEGECDFLKNKRIVYAIYTALMYMLAIHHASSWRWFVDWCFMDGNMVLCLG